MSLDPRAEPSGGGEPGRRSGDATSDPEIAAGPTRHGRELRRSPIAGESEHDRWQRNFGDLLQELRVAQTGVQILFAFLLTLPFSARFEQTTGFQRDVYVVALLAAAAATATIISPVAFHRALFRQGRKPELVRFSHHMATAGLGAMLLSMASSVLLITDFILDRTLAFVLSGATAVMFLTFWVLLPFVRREWGEDDPE